MRLATIFVGLLITVRLVESGQGPKYLNFEPGKTIASQLNGDERHVVIEKNLPPLLFGIPGDLPAKEILEGYTLHAAAVLVVRFTSKQSLLTEKGDWFVTRFKGRVLDQLKPRATVLVVDYFVLEVIGVSLTIGRTRVDATAFWEPEFDETRTYLLFPTSRRWPATDVIAYEVNSEGRLRNISRGFDPGSDTDNVHGMRLVDAKKLILSAPARGRPPL